MKNEKKGLQKGAFNPLLLILVSFMCLSLLCSFSEAGLLSGLIKNDISAVKSEIEKVENNFDTKINNTMSAVASLKLEMKATAQGNANAVAALKSEIKNTNNTIEGVQNNNLNTNDTGLMKYIISIIYCILVLVIGIIVKLYNAQIKVIKLEKKFYKDSYIAEKIKDEKELATLRKKHDSYIKSGGKL